MKTDSHFLFAKKRLIKTLAALVAASAALAACQTAPVEKAEANHLVKTVEFTTEEVETRTAFTEPDGNSYPVRWMADDEVAIFPNDLSLLQTAAVEPQQEGRTARLKASFALQEASEYNFWLLSPASALTSPGSGTECSLTIPTDQYPTATSVDPAAQILQARTDKLETLPDRIVLTPSHLSAYMKLSLVNVGSGLGEIKYVQLDFEVPVAGRVSYDFKTRTLNFDKGAPSKTVTAWVDHTTDVWFGFFPGLVGDKKMTVKVGGTKGSLSRDVTLPSGKFFFMGKIAIVTVDMASATPPTPPGDKVYGRIDEARFVAPEVQFVVATAADNLSWAMSATQGADFRSGVAVTKSNPGTKADESVETIVGPSDEVEVLTVEAGTASGTYAFRTKAGKYLAIDKDKNAALVSVDTKSILSDWRIRYSDGECEFRNNSTSYTYYLRYRKSDNKFVAMRSSFASGGEPIALYKLVGSGGSDYKKDPELRLAKQSLTLTEGETRRLGVALCYSLDDGGVVTFSSSDPTVATVDGNGDVTAVKAGEATITATVGETENYQAGSATCQVTVLAPVPVSSVTLDKTSVTVTEGESGQLTASVNPSNAANKKVTWSSSSPETVSVTQDGFFRGLKPGTATITAASVADPTKKATCVVTVNKFVAITGVTLDKTSLRMQKGETAKLTATVTPSNASNVQLIWGSTNTSVATVDQDGNVTAASDIFGVSCNIVVVARSQNAAGEYTATCTVTIGRAPVLKLQVARSMLDTASWQDYTGPFDLVWASQEWFFRLYDSANGLVVKDGTFTFVPGSFTAGHMQSNNYSYSVSNRTFWRVVLKQDGFLGFTPRYTNEEQGIDFSQEVVVYLTRPLDLWKDSYNVLPAGGLEMIEGATEKLYISHKTTGEYERIAPEFLTVTGGDASIAELVLDENDAEFTVKAKKAGETTWRVQYSHYGITLDRTVRIKVGKRYALYQGSTEQTGTEYTFTYDDTEDNTVAFRLYDNLNRQFVYSTSGHTVTVTSGTDNISASIDYWGASSAPTGVYQVYKVKALKRKQGWYTGKVSFYYAGELVKTLTIKVVMPTYSLRYSTSYSGFNASTPVCGQAFPITRGTPTYIRLYDETHGKYVSQANNYAGTSLGKLSLSTVYKGAYMGELTATVGNVYYPTINIYCTDGTDRVAATSPAVHVPCEINWATDTYDGTCIYSSIRYLGRSDEYFFLWNSTDKCVYEFDPNFMTATSSDPSVLAVSVTESPAGHHNSVRLKAWKEGRVRVTLHYNDGMGTSVKDFSYEFEVRKLPGA